MSVPAKSALSVALHETVTPSLQAEVKNSSGKEAPPGLVEDFLWFDESVELTLSLFIMLILPHGFSIPAYPTERRWMGRKEILWTVGRLLRFSSPAVKFLWISPSDWRKLCFPFL